MPLIEFGRNASQVSHTFRHTDAEGMHRLEVSNAITECLRAIEADLPEATYSGRVTVKGVPLEFGAHKFHNGSINVGRIKVLGR